MFPAALNLFFLCLIIHELYSWQKANFNLQIFIVKDFQVVIIVSSFLRNPVYTRFNTEQETLTRCENRNAENRW